MSAKLKDRWRASHFEREFSNGFVGMARKRYKEPGWAWTLRGIWYLKGKPQEFGGFQPTEKKAKLAVRRKLEALERVSK